MMKTMVMMIMMLMTLQMCGGVVQRCNCYMWYDGYHVMVVMCDDRRWYDGNGHER